MRAEKYSYQIKCKILIKKHTQTEKFTFYIKVEIYIILIRGNLLEKEERL